MRARVSLLALALAVTSATAACGGPRLVSREVALAGDAPEVPAASGAVRLAQPIVRFHGEANDAFEARLGRRIGELLSDALHVPEGVTTAPGTDLTKLLRIADAARESGALPDGAEPVATGGATRWVSALLVWARHTPRIEPEDDARISKSAHVPPGSFYQDPEPRTDEVARPLLAAAEDLRPDADDNHGNAAWRSERRALFVLALVDGETGKVRWVRAIASPSRVDRPGELERLVAQAAGL